MLGRNLLPPLTFQSLYGPQMLTTCKESLKPLQSFPISNIGHNDIVTCQVNLGDLGYIGDSEFLLLHEPYHFLERQGVRIKLAI